jgi:hypothetical protein
MTNETDYIIVQKYYFIAQQLTIYGGIILSILCLFGTLMNIITFFQRTYHRRASPFYLLCASIFDLAYLTPGSISNILQYGFHYDWTINSIIYCKLKNYLIYVLTIISGTLTVLASIDRFLLSSNNSKRWSYSSRSIAKRCVILIVIFWFTVSVPIIFCTKRYYRSSNNEQMICSNPSDNRLCFSVRVVYTCLFDGFFPPLIMMIFGVKTCNNMRHLHRRSKFKSLSSRRINQQLTLMLVLQSIKSSFASFPYSIFNTYWLLTINNKKSFIVEAKENLVRQILYLLFWSNYTSFFVYVYASDIFRNQWIKAMKKMICCLHRNRQQRSELKRLKNINDGKEQIVLRC